MQQNIRDFAINDHLSIKAGQFISIKWWSFRKGRYGYGYDMDTIWITSTLSSSSRTQQMTVIMKFRLHFLSKSFTGRSKTLYMTCISCTLLLLLSYKIYTSFRINCQLKIYFYQVFSDEMIIIS
jgi:hypothetical protein